MLIPILSKYNITIVLSIYYFRFYHRDVYSSVVRRFALFFCQKKGNDLQQLVRLNYIFSTFLLNVNFKRSEYFYVPRTRRSRTNWPAFRGEENH